MTYEWRDEGVKRVSTWSKAVRNAMLKGGAEFQRQKALNRAAGNWSKDFLHTTDTGVTRIRQVASTGVKCDSKRWGSECMLQLQEAEDRKTSAAATWAAEFTQGGGKQEGLRVEDQLRSYSRGRKETNDASNHVLICKVAAHDWSVDWTNKVLYVLEFKRTSDQRRDYRERGESRAMAHHDILVRSLEKVSRRRGRSEWSVED